MFVRAGNSATAELEPAGEHGVLHAHTTAHDDTIAHDAACDTAAHDAATAATATSATATSATTSVRRHDDSDSTIHERPESTAQRNEGSTHGGQLLKVRGG